jgi:hypothetical protein
MLFDWTSFGLKMLWPFHSNQPTLFWNKTRVISYNNVINKRLQYEAVNQSAANAHFFFAYGFPQFIILAHFPLLNMSLKWLITITLIKRLF